MVSPDQLAEPPKPGMVTPLDAIESPIEIAFRSGGVKFGISGAVVRFLIDHQTFRAGANNRHIIFRRHRPNFYGD